MLVSFSHYRNFGAAAVANAHNCKAIGIDIEPTTRPINLSTRKKFMTPDDYHTEEDLLTLWCKKEAAFKALSPLTGITLLKQVLLTQDGFTCLPNRQLQGQFYPHHIHAEGFPFLVIVAEIL